MTAIITRSDLARLTPSVFASTPWEGMSPRFRHVNTAHVLDIMESIGFHPVRARQSKSRIDGKAPFTRHCIRLRQADHLGFTVGEECPEIVLENAHDGSCAYRLHAGLWRTVCQNGLCVASADLGSISVKHSGGRDFDARITEATHRIAEGLPRALRQVEEWKQIILPRSRQIELAHEAWHLKPNEAVKPVWLLTARRPEDATNEDGSRSLWLSLNSVQEALIAGGVRGTNSRGRRIQTRPVKAVAKDIEINRKLWTMAEKYAEN